MDAARCARRLGPCVSVFYRRSSEEMPARREEAENAAEEGINFQFLVAPLEMEGDDKGRLLRIKCIRMKLGEPDASGRRSPVPIPGSEFVVECDVVVVAIGSRANPLLTSTCPDLKLNRNGNIAVDANGMTSLPGVFAGGDIVRGAATVILAMGDGKRTAQTIDRYFKQLQPNPQS